MMTTEMCKLNIFSIDDDCVNMHLLCWYSYQFISLKKIHSLLSQWNIYPFCILIYIVPSFCSCRYEPLPPLPHSLTSSDSGLEWTSVSPLATSYSPTCKAFRFIPHHHSKYLCYCSTPQLHARCGKHPAQTPASVDNGPWHDAGW